MMCRATSLIIMTLIASLALLLLPVVGHADTTELKFCNKTSNSVSFSIAGFDSAAPRNQWRSKGWWNIDGGECKELSLPEFKNRHIFVYAKGGGGYWKGDYVFCIHPNKAFDLKGDHDCDSRGDGFVERSFIHRKSRVGSYALDLTE